MDPLLPQDLAPSWLASTHLAHGNVHAIAEHVPGLEHADCHRGADGADDELT